MPEIIDFNAVRTELRAMDRGDLLIIAERAIELMPAAQLHPLLGDFVQLTARPAEESEVSASLLEEVRTFYDAAMAGNYYEIVEINNRGRQEQSRGTDAFVAEFHRLLRECISAAGQETSSSICAGHEGFELLFGLLRQIDEGQDDVLFFADEGSSSDVGVRWHTTLSAYFNCLAKTLSPQEFAQTVDEAITDFVNHDRQWYWDMANNIANDAQRIALRTITSQSQAASP